MSVVNRLRDKTVALKDSLRSRRFPPLRLLSRVRERQFSGGEESNPSNPKAIVLNVKLNLSFSAIAVDQI